MALSLGRYCQGYCVDTSTVTGEARQERGVNCVLNPVRDDASLTSVVHLPRLIDKNHIREDLKAAKIGRPAAYTFFQIRGLHFQSSSSTCTAYYSARYSLHPSSFREG